MRTFSIAMGFGLIFSVPSLADSNLPAGLELHSLREAEIAEKCRASILAKVDMVTTTNQDGKPEIVPKCVMLYRTVSASASSYLQESQAAMEEIGQTDASCDADATQKGCLEAGKKLMDAATNSHKRLVNKASEIEQNLSDLDLPEIAEENSDRPES
jgi:hypothetical protein